MKGGHEMETAFATISKAHIYQAIGLRDNFKKKEYDFSSEACISCPYRNSKLSEMEQNPFSYDCPPECASCSKLKENTKYINDRNKYGYRPRLKTKAFLMLIYLYFLDPSSSGYIQNIDARLAAERINCCERSVHNCMAALVKSGYIMAIKTSAHTYSVIINGYDLLYKPAKEGGRGYLTMSLDMLLELSRINNLIALRINVLELLSLDSPELRGQATIDNRNIKDIRRYLPAYAKRCIIIRQLKRNASGGREIVTYSHEPGTNVIRFTLKNDYALSTNKEKAREHFSKKMYSFICDFNSLVPVFNEHQDSLDYQNGGVMEMLITTVGENRKAKLIPNILFSSEFIEDVGALIMRYGPGAVEDSFMDMYSYYVMGNREMTNPGGLLRTIIEKNINDNKYDWKTA